MTTDPRLRVLMLRMALFVDIVVEPGASASGRQNSQYLPSLTLRVTSEESPQQERNIKSCAPGWFGCRALSEPIEGRAPTALAETVAPDRHAVTHHYRSGRTVCPKPCGSDGVAGASMNSGTPSVTG